MFTRPRHFLKPLSVFGVLLFVFSVIMPVKVFAQPRTDNVNVSLVTVSDGTGHGTNDQTFVSSRNGFSRGDDSPVDGRVALRDSVTYNLKIEVVGSSDGRPTFFEVRSGDEDFIPTSDIVSALRRLKQDDPGLQFEVRDGNWVFVPSGASATMIVPLTKRVDNDISNYFYSVKVGVGEGEKTAFASRSVSSVSALLDYDSSIRFNPSSLKVDANRSKLEQSVEIIVSRNMISYVGNTYKGSINRYDSDWEYDINVSGMPYGTKFYKQVLFGDEQLVTPVNSIVTIKGDEKIRAVIPSSALPNQYSQYTRKYSAYIQDTRVKENDRFVKYGKDSGLGQSNQFANGGREGYPNNNWAMFNVGWSGTTSAPEGYISLRGSKKMYASSVPEGGFGVKDAVSKNRDDLTRFIGGSSASVPGYVNNDQYGFTTPGQLVKVNLEATPSQVAPGTRLSVCDSWDYRTLELENGDAVVAPEGVQVQYYYGYFDGDCNTIPESRWVSHDPSRYTLASAVRFTKTPTSEADKTVKGTIFLKVLADNSYENGRSVFNYWSAKYDALNISKVSAEFRLLRSSDPVLSVTKSNNWGYRDGIPGDVLYTVSPKFTVAPEDIDFSSVFLWDTLSNDVIFGGLTQESIDNGWSVYYQYDNSVYFGYKGGKEKRVKNEGSWSGGVELPDLKYTVRVKPEVVEAMGTGEKKTVNNDVSFYYYGKMNSQGEYPNAKTSSSFTMTKKTAATVAKIVDTPVVEPGDDVSWTLRADIGGWTPGNVCFMDKLPVAGDGAALGDGTVTNVTGSISNVRVEPSAGLRVYYNSRYRPWSSLGDVRNESVYAKNGWYGWSSTPNPNAKSLMFCATRFDASNPSLVAKVTGKYTGSKNGEFIVNRMSGLVFENSSAGDVQAPGPVVTRVKLGSLSGHVFWDKDKNTAFGDMGEDTGIRDSRVTLEKQNPDGSWSVVSSTVTNEDGFYKFDGLKKGVYRVKQGRSSVVGAVDMSVGVVNRGVPREAVTKYGQKVRVVNTGSFSSRKFEFALDYAGVVIPSGHDQGGVDFGYWVDRPDLKVDKRKLSEGFDDSGDYVVDFEVEVANTGNVRMNDVVLRDVFGGEVSDVRFGSVSRSEAPVVFDGFNSAVDKGEFFVTTTNGRVFEVDSMREVFGQDVNLDAEFVRGVGERFGVRVGDGVFVRLFASDVDKVLTGRCRNPVPSGVVVRDVYVDVTTNKAFVVDFERECGFANESSVEVYYRGDVTGIREIPFTDALKFGSGLEGASRDSSGLPVMFQGTVVDAKNGFRLTGEGNLYYSSGSVVRQVPIDEKVTTLYNDGVIRTESGGVFVVFDPIKVTKLLTPGRSGNIYNNFEVLRLPDTVNPEKVIRLSSDLMRVLVLGDDGNVVGVPIEEVVRYKYYGLPAETLNDANTVVAGVERAKGMISEDGSVNLSDELLRKYRAKDMNYVDKSLGDFYAEGKKLNINYFTTKPWSSMSDLERNELLLEIMSETFRPDRQIFVEQSSRKVSRWIYDFYEKNGLYPHPVYGMFYGQEGVVQDTRHDLFGHVSQKTAQNVLFFIVTTDSSGEYKGLKNITLAAPPVESTPVGTLNPPVKEYKGEKLFSYAFDYLDPSQNAVFTYTMKYPHDDYAQFSFNAVNVQAKETGPVSDQYVRRYESNADYDDSPDMVSGGFTDAQSNDGVVSDNDLKDQVPVYVPGRVWDEPRVPIQDDVVSIPDTGGVGKGVGLVVGLGVVLVGLWLVRRRG